jgi:pyridoxine 4-dehydrogenase
MSQSPRISWSRLGLGTGTLASLGRASSIEDVEKLLASMLENGVSVIDTADTYGSGACERLLGRALRQKQDSFTLVTKAGYCHGDLPLPLRPLNPFLKKALQRIGRQQRFEPAYIAKCLERSLSRLGVDQVSAFMLHDATMEAITNDRLLSVLENLKNSGKTQAVGVSTGEPEVLQHALSTGIFEVVQTPASLRYVTKLQAIWRQCEAADIHVIGNHIFDPLCFRHPGMSHEMLMRASAAIMPPGATILCGTRNSSHLAQSKDWAVSPMPLKDAERLVEEIAGFENSDPHP